MNGESVKANTPPYLIFHPDENGRVLDVTIGEGWTLSEAAQALINSVQDILAKAKASEEREKIASAGTRGEVNENT